MKNYFADIVGIIHKEMLANEKFSAWFSAENFDYARFNHAKIRQAGTVAQHVLELDFIDGIKHASMQLGLSGKLSTDKEKITSAVKRLRAQIPFSADDPYLMLHDGKTNTESITNNELTDKAEVVETVLQKSQGLDLVGIYFGGPIYKGFAGSSGQMNWFEKSSFVLDCSFYHSGDKAVKQSYADTRWDPSHIDKKIEEVRLGLKLFDQEAKAITPGEYRVYFSPSAVNELLGVMNWGGFSRKSLEVKNSPLMALQAGSKNLSPLFSLSENIAAGMGPGFQSQGFMKPANLSIIERGHLKNTLISPKTAKEYHLDHNGADETEALCAIDMQGGQLADIDIMSTLGDGLYINNLWYLNFSDRQNGCLTGMTRFLCFMVKNGKPVAPFSVMRFDDSIYRMFGDNLCYLTERRELLIDSSTYDERSTASALLPGIIVDKVRFTL